MFIVYALCWVVYWSLLTTISFSPQGSHNELVFTGLAAGACKRWDLKSQVSLTPKIHVLFTPQEALLTDGKVATLEGVGAKAP